MYQLLCGAMTLHENGVLHRDLKPGNILVSKNCDVKITDFGLSRYIPHGGRKNSSHQQHPHQETHTSTEKGKELMTEYVVTRWYRPPEIMLAPNGTYNESVDMWSIGCIFGELLNRRPLFPGTDFIDQLTKVFSVLPVPAADKRGYAVDGDALKFLESLPPCSPSAMTKTFRKTSPEAVSLLRRLLCINPERRITAKQALAHPYFKNIRQQLGEPPEFQVARAFDFEFDNHEFPLSHLKQLIQDEVKLLQKDRQDPSAASSAPILSTNAVTSSDSSHGDYAKQQKSGDLQRDGKVQSDTASNNASKHASSSSKDEQPHAKHAKGSPTTRSGADSLSDEEIEEEDVEHSLLVESLDSKDGPPLAPKEFLAKEQQKERNQMPESDDAEPANSDSDSECGKQQQQQQQQQKQQPHRSKQPTADSDDEQQEIIQVERSRRPIAASKLERPKSATLTRKPTAAATHSSRDSRDEEHRQHTNRASNNHHHSSSHEAASERWGHPRATTSSRIHHPVYGATMSTNNHDKRAKPSGTSTATRTHSSAATSRASSNQHSARETTSSSSSSGSHPSEKSDTSRRPERVSISTSSSSSHRSTTSKTTPTSSSSGGKDALPDGWIKKTHSKSGREYYYDTLHKVSSWKHPSKMLENIFGTTRVPSSSSSNQHKVSSSSSTPTSADSITPTSSKIATSSSRRASLSGGASSSTASAAALPKDWARRTDPKSGRLFYVNLLTNKSFAKLPSSVTASMLNLNSKDSTMPSSSASSGPSATAAATAASKKAAVAADPLRKKITVPQSPQFSQMSWQRKKVPSTDD